MPREEEQLPPFWDDCWDEWAGLNLHGKQVKCWISFTRPSYQVGVCMSRVHWDLQAPRPTTLARNTFRKRCGSGAEPNDMHDH